MNNKKTYINKHLGIQKKIEILFIENIQLDINKGFKYNKFNNSCVKDDHITIINYLNLIIEIFEIKTETRKIML